MKVKVRTMGILTPLEKEISLPKGTTIKQLIEIIIKENKDIDEELIKTSTFIVNQNTANLKTILMDKDKVFILSTLGGG